MQYELYSYCKEYYDTTNKGIFNAPDDARFEIFHESFKILWRKIDNRAIYVEDGIIKDKKGNQLDGSILTYFMGIAKMKYKEWLCEHPFCSDLESEVVKEIRKNGFDEKEYLNTLYGDSNNVMLDIIADAIARMSSRCKEILTKFYYEGKKLDMILLEIPSIETVNALKTKKYKCMESLRVMANETYKKYLNS